MFFSIAKFRTLLSTSLCLLAFVHATNTFAAKPEANEEKIKFNLEIRPLLSDKCFHCHGPDKKHREADLRLDIKEGAFADLGDGPVIVSGHPQKSSLIARITETDADIKMPPPESGKELTPKEIDLIRRWIKEGANWEEHWSFQLPKKLDLPKVSKNDWPEKSVDNFILARLEKEGLKPSPETDKSTQIRRVTFDLTGLPPNPKDVENYLKDNSPNAYEKVVDRLLASKAYGEHMSRFWLDAARYGDTHGLHLDNYREMWVYRDWVINSFNSNMPFDQFTIKQLAGDLLPNYTQDDLIASGYNRCHVSTNEGGTIPEEAYVRNVVDRVENASTVFMGLTMGCAVCHDHKFDPISQKEFYQMFAFFNSIDGSPMDGNVKNHMPFIYVPNDTQEKQRVEISKRQLAARNLQVERQKQAEPVFKSWLSWQSEMIQLGSKPIVIKQNPSGLIAHIPLDEGKDKKVVNKTNAKEVGKATDPESWTSGRLGKAYEIKDEKSYVELNSKTGALKKNSQFTVGMWVKTTGKTDGTILAKMDVNNRIMGFEVRANEKKVTAIISRSFNEFRIELETETDVLVPGQWHHVTMTYDNSAKASGINVFIDGKEQKTKTIIDTLGIYNSFTGRPFTIGCRGIRNGKTVMPLVGATIDDVKIFNRRLLDSEIIFSAFGDLVEPTLRIAENKRTAQDNDLLQQYYFTAYDDPYKKQEGQIEKARRDTINLLKQTPTTLVFKETEKPKPAHILIRGEYDQKGDVVQRSTPDVLPAFDKSFPKNRLGLAMWLTQPNHPLTSRVAVNRFWQQVFGTGIVKTSEDFGSQGEPPTHPELLDWLSVDFQENGWDVKRLIKQLVMSSTYQQDSRITPELFAKDPENRLLARGPRFRLDAEMIRDQALTVSGLLVEKIGGPSVKPPQPEGLWLAVGYSGSNTVKFSKDTGADKIYRRSLYTFMKRTSPPPQMSTLDAPNRESCVVRRERTNTPLQALLLMNDPQFVEAGQFFGKRIMKEGGQTPEDRIRWAFSLATSREVSDQRLKVFKVAYDAFLKNYKNDPKSAKAFLEVGETKLDPKLNQAELATWGMIANLILNLDEVITKE